MIYKCGICQEEITDHIIRHICVSCVEDLTADRDRYKAEAMAARALLESDDINPVIAVNDVLKLKELYNNYISAMEANKIKEGQG